MNRKHSQLSLVFALTMVIGGLAGCSNEPEQTSAEPSPRDAAAPARLVCYGYIDARDGPLILQPTRSGRVIRVLVKEKQAVSVDAPLVQIDDHLAHLQVEESELGVTAAELQLARAQDGIKQYQAKIAQIEAAVEVAGTKVLSAQDYLQFKEKLNFSEADVNYSRRQLDEARALERAERSRQTELRAVDPNMDVKLAQVQVQRSQLLLKQAQQNLDEYLLKAPVAAMVLRVQVQEGDLVSPTSGKPALVLVPQGSLIVRAEVSQEFADRVQSGQTVQVEDEPSGRLLGQGHMTDASDWFLPRRQLSPEPTGINTGLTMECIIVLDEGHAPLRFGQRVRVRVF